MTDVVRISSKVNERCPEVSTFPLSIVKKKYTLRRATTIPSEGRRGVSTIINQQKGPLNRERGEIKQGINATLGLRLIHEYFVRFPRKVRNESTWDTQSNHRALSVWNNAPDIEALIGGRL